VLNIYNLFPTHCLRVDPEIDDHGGVYLYLTQEYSSTMEYRKSRACYFRYVSAVLMKSYSGGPTSGFWKLRLIQNVFQLESRNSQDNPLIRSTQGLCFIQRTTLWSLKEDSQAAKLYIWLLLYIIRLKKI
jgi:hypothetical protein